jgi:hypothetical protein
MKHLKNNHNKLVGFVLLSLLIVCSACSCKRDCQDYTNPDCENYNPCYGKEKPSAKFIMEEGGMREWQNGQQVEIFYPDSVFQGFGIRFRSELTDLKKYKHTWYVGSEVFENVYMPPIRHFGNTARPQNITISHVIEYTPDLQCFPDDDGKDSVAQTFRLIAEYNELKAFGKFQGRVNDTGQVFIVEILPIRRIGNQITYWPGYGQLTDKMIVNFQNEGDTLFGTQGNQRFFITILNHHWWFNNELSKFQGTGYINDLGEFEMNYTKMVYPIPSIKPHYTFKGTKID